VVLQLAAQHEQQILEALLLLAPLLVGLLPFVLRGRRDVALRR
jgi:hypothetical protein